MKKNYCFILAVLSFIFAVPSARGDEFRLVPSIAAREEYNSNVFVSSIDKRTDFVTTISPGIEVVKRNERLDTSARIRLDSINYTDNRDFNATAQTYNGSIRYRIMPNFGLGAEAGYLIDSSPDSDLLTTGLVTSTLRRERANASLSTDYQFTELTALSLSYAYMKDASEKKYSDIMSHDINAGLMQDFSKYIPALKGLLNFGYSQYDIAGFRTESMMSTLGASRNFSEIWGVNVIGGARYTKSEFPVLRLQEVAPTLFQMVEETKADDGWGWVAQASVTYKGERENGDLTYSRDVKPASGQRTAMERNSLAMNLRYKVTHEFSFSLNASYFTNKSGQLASSTNAIDTQSFMINPRLRYEFSRDTAVEATYDYTMVDDLIAGKQAERHRVSVRLSIQHAFLE